LRVEHSFTLTHKKTIGIWYIVCASIEEKIKLSIVIPCYDEEKVLPLTLEQLN